MESCAGWWGVDIVKSMVLPTTMLRPFNRHDLRKVWEMQFNRKHFHSEHPRSIKSGRALPCVTTVDLPDCHGRNIVDSTRNFIIARVYHF